MGKKRLRSGFTTGACAAAAAKAALVHLVSGQAAPTIRIPFPDGEHRVFTVYESTRHSAYQAEASIIKDAGDDPDVTNGAEIKAEIKTSSQNLQDATAPEPVVRFVAGEGVGTVTKPGLRLAVGEPAINPVPRQMIREALIEGLLENDQALGQVITVTIKVPNGRVLAEKTLNHRLGIVGGLSILGTTGIVRPVSAEAWTATIEASMSVAIETGCTEIVLSTGRTSEKGGQNYLNLPIEAFAMMGDYLQFSLEAAAKHRFSRIHLTAMWAKIVKAAMGIGQTHVRHGALEASEAALFIGNLCHDPALAEDLADANTAREIYVRLLQAKRNEVITEVCLSAKTYAQKMSGLPVDVYLINSAMEVVTHV